MDLGSDSDSTSSSYTSSSEDNRVLLGDPRSLQVMREHMERTWKGRQGPGPVGDVSGGAGTGTGLYDPLLEFVDTRRVHVLMVDSLDRDQLAFPLPTQARFKLPRMYRRVERIDIVQIKFMNGLYGLSAARANTTLWVAEGSTPVAVTIPDGAYTISTLVTALTAALNNTTGLTATYRVTYSGTTGRITIAASSPFTLLFKSGTGTFGWNLGWGGAPTDVGPTTSATADHLPRLADDYVFLRLNDTALMNTVDHTEPEQMQLGQSSTGQTDHYFGKLLLSPFGCWTQTLVEAPKTFTPPLGRLERLDVEWLDRSGRVLTGPDAASCDWHMTVRIVELLESPVKST